MQIKVVNYTASVSPIVQAFVDVEIDGWLRFNGLNLLRDGSLRPAQLTPWRYGKRLFFDAVQILDGDLSKSLEADILMAISQHVATLPLEERIKAPLATEQRRTIRKVAAASANSKPLKVPLTVKPTPAGAASPNRSEAGNSKAAEAIHAKPLAEKPKLSPPVRLLDGYPTRTAPASGRVRGERK